MAVVVLTAGPRQRANRLLALALAVEAAAQGGHVIYMMVGRVVGGAWGLPFSYAGWLAVGAIPFVYLMLLSILETPLVRWLKPLPIRVALGASALISGLLSLGAGFAVRPPEAAGEISRQFPRWVFQVQGMSFLLIESVLLFALVVAFDAFRRAQLGSAARQRARAFLMSFGIRDVIGFIGLGLILIGAAKGEAMIGPRVTQVGLGEDIARLGTIVAIPLLAYGILRAQLFDIDLRIRLGIQRGTLVTFVALVLLIVFKVAEAWLSRSAGWAAGGVVAGLLLFVAPRLIRAADRVARSAMPGVTRTPEYLTFRKLEVYRAAVESALETGVLDARGHEMLRRLCLKLGLNPEDAVAVEAEVAAMRQGQASPATVTDVRGS